MSNKTTLVTKRKGTRSGCAPGSRRFSVTVREETFLALQAQAAANRHGLSGEASNAIERDLARAVIARAPEKVA